MVSAFKRRLVSIAHGLAARLRKYFSGKLVLVQITAGLGAFAARSFGAYLAQDLTTWSVVAVSMLCSFVGYVVTYALGYLVAFRRDYRESGRSMALDVFRLQLVEQLPNAGTVVVSGLAQGALIAGTGMQPVLAVNLASWVGPHKIINFAAMALSNTLKRAWVDGSWKPREILRALGRVLGRIDLKGRVLGRNRKSPA